MSARTIQPQEVAVASAKWTSRRFVIFTNRDPSVDFRRPLVEALRQRHETYYFCLVGGRISMAWPAQREMSLTQLIRFVLGTRRDGKQTVYLNSASTIAPALMVLLRLISRGVWCFDMHDDLLYYYTGLRRLRVALSLALVRRFSHFTLLASPQLAELFPRSCHLGNASHIRPIARDDAPDNTVLMFASLDERFDFGFCNQVLDLCPSMEFHLYGYYRADDQVTQEELRRLAAAHPNMHYHGPYALDDVPQMLGMYRVMFAPFQTGIRMTQYIDPLRFYHCLNSGMEVVSTAIPQAERMRQWIHVVRTPDECAQTLAAVLSGRAAKRQAYIPVTWEQKADQLVSILDGRRAA